MVPFLMCIANNETERKMVLSELSRRSAKCHETKTTISQRIGTIQSRKRGKTIGKIFNEIIFVFISTTSTKASLRKIIIINHLFIRHRKTERTSEVSSIQLNPMDSKFGARYILIILKKPFQDFNSEFRIPDSISSNEFPSFFSFKNIERNKTNKQTNTKQYKNGEGLSQDTSYYYC